MLGFLISKKAAPKDSLVSSALYRTLLPFDQPQLRFFWFFWPKRSHRLWPDPDALTEFRKRLKTGSIISGKLLMDKVNERAELIIESVKRITVL